MGERAKRVLDIKLTPFEGCSLTQIRCKHYRTWRKFPHTIYLLDDVSDFARLIPDPEDQLIVINAGLRQLQESQIVARDMESAEDINDF
ncbi:MAG: hypothetical protein KGL64_11375 [Acidobacteriota bacterium]|nr:hypothetical protein [Acidobacteriota bacterium]